MTYCYTCRECGQTREVPGGAKLVFCTNDDTPMRRDYRAEAVGLGTGVRVSREGTDRDRAELFLPSNRDLAGPGDPDGKKGAAEWLERFQPETSKTKNPLLETEKVSF